MYTRCCYFNNLKNVLFYNVYFWCYKFICLNLPVCKLTFHIVLKFETSLTKAMCQAELVAPPCDEFMYYLIDWNTVTKYASVREIGKISVLF